MSLLLLFRRRALSPFLALTAADSVTSADAVVRVRRNPLSLIAHDALSATDPTATVELQTVVVRLPVLFLDAATPALLLDAPRPAVLLDGADATTDGARALLAAA